MNKIIKSIIFTSFSIIFSAHAATSVPGKTPEYDKTFHATLVEVPYNQSLVSKNGVYDSTSPLAQVKGKEVSYLSALFSKENKNVDFSISRNIAYVKAVETTVSKDGATVTNIIPGTVATGFYINAQSKGNDYFDISAKYNFINRFESIKVKGEKQEVQRPDISSWTLKNKNIYIPSGKVARFDSQPYSVKGKEFQKVLFVSIEDTK